MMELHNLKSAAPEGIVWVTFDDVQGGTDPLAIPVFGLVSASALVTSVEDDRSRTALPQPVKAGRPRLVAAMSARSAFTELALNCLAQMQANEAPAKLGHDPEGIHQFRIGLRRFRALVAAFGNMLSAESHRDLARELRWLQQELTAVRDWEVFATSTLGPIAQRIPDLQYALVAAHKLRGIAQNKARAALESRRYAALLLKCHIWLATGAWTSSKMATLDEPIGDFATASLQRRHRRLRKFGGKHADLPGAELHRLRMLVKKQRYLCDFVRELYPKRPTTRYVSALAGVQDLLGEINDSRVALRLTAELELYMTSVASVGPGVATRSAGIVLGWQAAAREERQADVRHLWRDFRACKTFWSHATS
jgi:triphosphatase